MHDTYLLSFVANPRTSRLTSASYSGEEHAGGEGEREMEGSGSIGPAVRS